MSTASVPARLTRRSVMVSLGWLPAPFAAPGLATAAEAGALVTILEGDARIVDGKGATAAAEGLRIDGTVLVDTPAAARLLRLEWAPGRALDLGPDTRVMLLPPALPGSDVKAPAFYLLRGWIKVTAPAGASSSGFLLPGADVPPFTGTLVAHVSASDQWLFTESGSARVVERRKGAAPLSLKGSETWQRSGSEGVGTVQPRPTSEQLKLVPRSFRDTLPMRSAAMAGRSVTPRALPFPPYADLRDWLLAEPGLRRELPRRFAGWAREPAFRSAVDAQLSQHAEWTLVLHPDRAKPPARPAAPSSPPGYGSRPASAPR